MPHTAPIPTPPPGAKTTKKDRKLMQKRQLTLKNAGQTLTMQQLSLAGLMHVYKEPATFGSSFETLVRASSTCTQRAVLPVACEGQQLSR